MRRFLLLAACLTAAACATVPAGPPRTDATFTRIQQGMTPEDVRRIAGAPDETMPFPLSRSNSWAWYGYDTWGYYVLYSVTFGPDGRVASTFARRLNDGGDMQ